MIEITGNIFDQHDADAICVTTNGVVKANGELVMGAGLAKQFAERYSPLSQHLGNGILKYRGTLTWTGTTYVENDSCVQVYYTWDFDGGWLAEIRGMESEWLSTNPDQISLLDSTDPEDVAFVKQMRTKQPHVVSFPTKLHFKDPSPLWLVERSAVQLVFLINNEGWKKIVLPRPVPGLGGLKWEDVKAVISPILDDRFYVITPENSK